MTEHLDLLIMLPVAIAMFYAGLERGRLIECRLWLKAIQDHREGLPAPSRLRLVKNKEET